MNPYKNLRQLLGSTSVALASAIGLAAQQWVESVYNLGSTSFAIILLVVVAGARLIELLFANLLDRSYALRRLFYRRYDVEGIWIDLVLTQNGPPLLGITRLEIRDYEVHWNGENYDINGRIISTFRTLAGIVDWPTLRFWCKDDPSGKPVVLNENIVQIQFSPSGQKCPTRYAGWGVVPGISEPARIIGKRVTEPTILADLDSNQRAATLLRIANTFPELESYSTLPESPSASR